MVVILSNCEVQSNLTPVGGIRAGAPSVGSHTSSACNSAEPTAGGLQERQRGGRRSEGVGTELWGLQTWGGGGDTAVPL